ncbi:MAG: cupin domain-containing protein [Spirochaetales bacterium]|nr:cupin domain-containing protein [Spirochaetales bacterium]
MDKNETNKGFYFASECPVKDLGGGVRRQILAHGNDLMVCHLWFEKGAVGSAHQHPHIQSTYILKGKFRFTIGGVTKDVSAGDCLYKTTEIVHGCTCLEEGELLDIFNPPREEFLK